MPTAIVYPCSADALMGAVEAVNHKLIAPILVGPEDEIRKIAAAEKVDLADYKIIATADAEESAAKATAMASKGDAHALMKGSLHTDQFMHAIVAKESHLRTNRLLSHCMLISLPTYALRVIISDAAINIAPDVDQKKDIIQNAIILARAIGIDPPKVAILSAVEVVRTNMPSTMAAAALAKMADRYQIAGGIVDGPLDLDIAVDPESARVKGIKSPVAGQGRHSDRTQHRRRQHDLQGAFVHERRPRRGHRHGRKGASDLDQPVGQRGDTDVLVSACCPFRRCDRKGSEAATSGGQ